MVSLIRLFVALGIAALIFPFVMVALWILFVEAYRAGVPYADFFVVVETYDGGKISRIYGKPTLYIPSVIITAYLTMLIYKRLKARLYRMSGREANLVMVFLLYFAVASFLPFVVQFFTRPQCTMATATLLHPILFLPAVVLAKWKFDKRAPLALLLYPPIYLLTEIPLVKENLREVEQLYYDMFHAVVQCYNYGVLIAFTVVIVPVVEEVMFRGILFEVIKSKWGAAPAYLISSAAFAILHPVFNPIVALVYFTVAMALAFAYHKLGLPAAIALHVAINAVATATYATDGG